MEMQEIPVAQWPALLDQFSRAHRGDPVIVETSSPELGVRSNARDLPLLGITAQPEQGESIKRGVLPRIQIMTGRAASAARAHITHVIERPLRVRFAEWNDGVSGSIEIEAQDHQITCIRAGPAQQTLPPGMITDGYLPREG